MQISSWGQIQNSAVYCWSPWSKRGLGNYTWYRNVNSLVTVWRRKGSFQKYTSARFCEVKQVRDALQQFSSGKGKSRRNNAINSLSVHSTIPALCNFPFMEEIFSNNLYAILSFESRHTTFLGISKMLKDCALYRLNELSFLKTSIFQSLVPKILSSICRKALSFLFQFLAAALNHQ